WMEEFKNPQYLLVDKKPLLIFFEYTSLLKNFGSAEAVSEAFAKLRQSAKDAGLAGASIAICAGSPDGVAKAESCGADGLRLVDAVSQVGGFTSIADSNHVILTRRISKEKTVTVVIAVDAITDGAQADIPLQAGDTIKVEARVF
ncbi:MAG: hypothetical protein ABIP39_05650, partial [Polyangiaceae bacterium]